MKRREDSNKKGKQKGRETVDQASSFLKNTSSKIVSVVGGVLIGAALGATAALLFAPTSGRRVRKNLADGSKNLVDQFKTKVSDSVKDAKSSLSSAAGRMSSAAVKV